MVVVVAVVAVAVIVFNLHPLRRSMVVKSFYINNITCFTVIVPRVSVWNEPPCTTVILLPVLFAGVMFVGVYWRSKEISGQGF